MKGDAQRAEEELPALYAAQGLRVPIPVMIAALLIAWLASDRAPPGLLIGWVSAVALMLWMRWMVNRAAARTGHIPILYRMNAMVFVSFLTGVVHGQSVLFWPYMSDLGHVVQSMFVLGLCAGAVATEFGYMRIIIAYLFPMLWPLSTVWAQALATPGESWLKGSSGVMLLMMAMYGGLLAVLARDTFKLFKESFDYRQQLKEALAKAEAANRSKTRFLASASHDLRQPMHTLSLFSAALAMRPLDSVTRDIVVQLNMAMQALSTQLDTLLDISKLDAGVVPVNRRNFLLLPYLSRLIEEFKPIAQRKNLELKLEIGLSSGDACHSDPLLLERVLRNLIDNAIKYTETGRVTLSAKRTASHFELSVRDTGAGIPLAEQAHVFEEFYQLDNPSRDRSQGLGLGLSIVSRLSDLLQLGIALQSHPGQGTSFAMQVAAARASDEVIKVNASSLPSISGLCVLVIDDEESVRTGMRVVLQTQGCTVLLAAGTEEALACVGQTRPDIVLADFRLHGDDDGLAAVRRLRALYPGLPALLVSGDTAPARLREAHDAGLRLLHKPASADTLIRAIHEEIVRQKE